MSLPIALQMYSVKDQFTSDPQGTLKRVREMGYDGVETGLSGFEPEQLKAWCDEAGLPIVAAHVPLGAMLSDPVGTLLQHAKLGTQYMVLPFLAAHLRAGTPNFPYIVEFIRQLGMAARELGLVLLYHNHDFDFAKFKGQYALDYLYESIPAELLQTELDTCWVNVGGEDPAAYITKYAGRTPVVHLKDFKGEKPQDGTDPFARGLTPEKAMIGFEYRPLGEGLQDMPGILQASVDAGAEWVIVEQDHPCLGLTSMECAERSVRYLRSFQW